MKGCERERERERGRSGGGLMDEAKSLQLFHGGLIVHCKSLWRKVCAKLKCENKIVQLLSVLIIQ